VVVVKSSLGGEVGTYKFIKLSKAMNYIFVKIPKNVKVSYLSRDILLKR
jgi:hypothetical protein